MTNRQHFVLLAVLILLAAMFLQKITKSNAISLVPLPLLLSIISAWLLPKRLAVFIILAIITELYSLTPLLVMTLVVFLPWIMQRLRGRIEPDLSFSYFLLIGLTVALQIVVLVSPSVATNSQLYGTDIGLLEALPWRHMLITWALTSTVSFLIIVFLPSLALTKQTSIISVERKKINH